MARGQDWWRWKCNLVPVPEAGPASPQEAESTAGSARGRVCKGACVRTHRIAHTHERAHTQSPFPCSHISLGGTRQGNFLFDGCLFTIPKTGPSFRKTEKSTTHFARTAVQEGVMVNFRRRRAWATGCADISSHMPWDVSVRAVLVERNI